MVSVLASAGPLGSTTVSASGTALGAGRAWAVEPSGAATAMPAARAAAITLPARCARVCRILEEIPPSSSAVSVRPGGMVIVVGVS